jgi:hypothetical protein
MFIVLIGDISATTYAKTTLKKFVETSTAIVNATVVESNSSWDDEHKNIYTYTKVKINEVYKSKDLPNEIIIKQLGGRVGEESLEIESNPEFKIDETALLFLIYFENNWIIHSIGMGKFDIIDESGSLIAINPRINKELIETEINCKDKNVIYPNFLLEELKNKIDLYKK